MAKAVKRATAGSWTYTLKRDEGATLDERSEFVLRQLNGAERAAVMDNLSRRRTLPDRSVETAQRTRQEARAMCLSHIEAVKNFPAGDPKPWPDSIEDRETYLELLDDDDVYELGNEIYAHSVMDGERGKAVGESSPPAPTSS
jgi:hypothetical protein